MTKLNYFIKFKNKFNIIINKLLKDNLNKLNSNYFSKITSSNKFILSSIVLIVLLLSYLSIPNIYDKNKISKILKEQLENKFNLNFSLSENIKYSFYPSPHFIFKNSSIIKDKNEISQIEELKIFIYMNNFFSSDKIKAKNLILEKSNFNLNNQSYNFFITLLNSNLEDSKLIIKNSNLFYRNKDDEVLFINKILDMKYFYDDKNLQNNVISKNEVFNSPYLLELTKDEIKNKIFSNLKSSFLNLEIYNELNFNKEVKNGLATFKLRNESFDLTYDVKENNFIFDLYNSIENSKFSYKGDINFKPFYSKLTGITKKINLFYLLNSNALILQLLKTEILNNKKLNFDLDIYADETQNFNNFENIFFNFKIEEGLINIDHSKFSWKDSAEFLIKDSLIYAREGELILDAKLDLNIKNSNEIYKFLQTPKKFRTKLKNIKANFSYNFDQNVINLNNIIIDNNDHKEVNKILKSLIFKKNQLQNRVYLKSIFNKALKFYAG